MKRLWRTARQSVYVPAAQKAEDTVAALGRSGRVLFYALAAVCVVSALALVFMLNQSLLVPTPARGGDLSEGLIGTPRFINPILALSDADRDLTALVYSGLLRASPDGSYAPDLAEGYDVSPDGRVYTAVLRQDAVFQDNTPITADDVVFTIQKTQDSALKSPERANWDGVLVEAVDPRTVRFTLKAPYAPFVENLTLGIMPKHLWSGVSDDEFSFTNLNTSPVGSGPFAVGSISRGPGGVPNSYTLKAFDRYAQGAPYLSTITLKFYQSEAALRSALAQGDVAAASGLSPSNLPRGADIRTAPLNRVFGVFYNQNQSEALRDANVRNALEQAVDREDLIAKVLGGYGTPLTGPVPPSLVGTAPEIPSGDALAAQQYLLGKGWVLQGGVLQKTTGKGTAAKTTQLAFTLATGNVPELRAAAEYLRERWQAMGAQVEIQVFEQGDLSQNVIRPRKYDALLFGEVVGRELDLFAFWHSSQRNDPGLNIAGYANAAADKALAALRTTDDTAERRTLYQTVLRELTTDKPALFLYAPDFVYTVPTTLSGLNLGLIETPSDRFLSVAQWHLETDYVWPLFARARN